MDKEESKKVLIKSDFPLKTKHQSMLREAGCDLDKIIEIRKYFHRHPEGQLKEYETQKKIMNILIENFGMESSQVRSCGGTGVIADIYGTGESKMGTTLKMIALRADMDGLRIPETDKDLPYISQTEYAHMCGHDGHMATLLATAQVLIKHRNKIPSNQCIRLLFQPAEEGPGGALPMIKDGCLDGVDEIYGLHNRPVFDQGDIRVIGGAILASSTTVNINILGQGGHGSLPHRVQDVITAGASILQNLHVIKSRFIEGKEHFVFSITQFHSGFTYNVFPDDAFIQGTIRTFSSSVLQQIKDKIQTICKTQAEVHGCKTEIEFDDLYPCLVNHEVEASHIQRLGKKWFGDERCSSKDLPITGSEDFSFYLLEKPGCFFYIGTHDDQYPDRDLHQSNYDYNDEMIASGSYFELRLIEDRLDARILPSE